MYENTKRPYFWERSIGINLGKIKIDNFNVASYQKTQMIDTGYETTMRFLNKRLSKSVKDNLCLGQGDEAIREDIQEYLNQILEESKDLELCSNNIDWYFDFGEDLFLRLDSKSVDLEEQYSYLGDTLLYNTNQCRHNLGSFPCENFVN